MKDLVGIQRTELQEILAGWGQPAFRAGQVMDWVYRHRARDFRKMSSLPEPLRRRLSEEFVVSSLEVQETLRSKDGTVKLLLRLADGNFVEAVDIPAHGRVPASPHGPGTTKQRLTGCISSQAGCRYACSFCASGKAGFKRNLSSAEICGELLLLQESMPGQALSHIVFMGTGEPLDNYDNVIAAIRQINSPDGFGIGARRITVSTCGIIPGIRRLAKEGMQIELSVSLHAPDDRTRSRIMPVNRIYPVKELIDACREYAADTGRQVTFEYILIEGLNSDLQYCVQLSRIVKGMNCKVNLIPFNPVFDDKGGEGSAPDARQVRAFRDRLAESGVQATVRTPRGTDIDAACGQLRLRYEKN